MVQDIACEIHEYREREADLCNKDRTSIYEQIYFCKKKQDSNHINISSQQVQKFQK